MTSQTVNDTAIGQLYGIDKPMPEHPRKGQYAFLRSVDPNTDGAIAKIDRAFPDWAQSNTPHALTYIRRLVRRVPYLDISGNVYQVTIRTPAPEASDKGEFRSGQAVLVHESEIANPYNGVKPSYKSTFRFTTEALRFHILNPHLCIFENCRSNNIRVVGMGIRDAKPKSRMLCDVCFGEWTQTLTVMGAY